MGSRIVLIVLLILVPNGVLAQADDESPQEKSPAVAGLASAVMPGLGQFMNGEPLKGVGFLGAAILASAYVLSGQSGDYHQAQPRRVLLLLGVHVVSAIDAVKSAEAHNRALDHHGHLLEVTGEEYALGVDLFADESTMGLVVSVHY